MTGGTVADPIKTRPVIPDTAAGRAPHGGNDVNYRNDLAEMMGDIRMIRRSLRATTVMAVVFWIVSLGILLRLDFLEQSGRWPMCAHDESREKSSCP